MATLMKEDFAALKHDVLTLRDELKLKMHLAKMDMKTEWAKLEPQAEKVWNEMTEKSVEAAKDLKKRFIAMRDELNRH